jgi:hypothetical protein
MQLNTFVIDASLASSDDHLKDYITQLYAHPNGYLSFIIENSGTATAYICTEDDVINAVVSSSKIESAKTLVIGPYEWPDHIPWLRSLLGSICRITAFWSEKP